MYITHYQNQFESTLVFDTSQAIVNLQNLSNQVNQYSNSLSRNAAVTRGFNTGQTKLETTFRGGVQATKQATNEQKKLENQVKRSNAEANRLQISWRSVLRVFSIQIVGRAVTGLVSELSQSVNRARELQIALAEIQTISPEFQAVGLEGVQAATELISADFGIDQVEVARGVYQALSNQIGNTTETIQFLNDAAEFSIATNTELSASVDLLSGTLNALGLSASQTRRLMDTLFKTIELGRVTGPELATSLGRILPVADDLGVSFEELNALFATTTIQGISFDDAATRLNRVMVGLLKPTNELQSVLDGLGISSVRAGVQANGLEGFLRLLLEQTDGTIEGTVELFNEIRELQGVLAATKGEGDEFTETLRQIQEDSRGAARAAAQLVFDTPAQQLQQAIQEFRNIIIRDFGNELIDVFNNLIQLMGGVEGATTVFFNVAKAAALTLIPLFGFQLAAAIGSMTAALVNATAAAVGFNTALTTGPGIVIALIAALAAANIVIGVDIVRSLTEAEDNIRDFEEATKSLGESLTEIRKTALENQQDIADGIKQTANDSIAAINQQVFELQRLYQQDKDEAIAAQDAITDNLNNQVRERTKIVDDAIDQIADAQKTAVEEIEKLGKQAASFDFDINQRRFNLNLQATEDDPRRQANLLQRRVQELLRAAQQAQDPKEQEQLLQNAAQRAEQLARIEGQRTAGARALNQVQQANKRLIDDQIKAREKQLKLEQQLEPELRSQQSQIQRTANEIDTLQKRLNKGIGTLSEPQINALQQRLNALRDDLQNQFQQFATTAAPILDEQEIERLIAPFRSAITGEEVTLSIAAEESVNQTLEILNRIPSSIPINVELRLEQLAGAEFGVQGFGAIQSGLSETNQEIANLSDNTTEVTQAQLDLSEAQQTVNTAIREGGQAVVQFSDEINDLANQTAAQENVRRFGDQLDEVKESVRELPAEFGNLRKQIQDAVQQGDINRLQQLQEQIPNLIESFNEIAGPEQAQQVSTLLNNLSQGITNIIDAQVKLQQANQSRRGLAVLLSQVRDVSELIQDEGLGQNAKTNFDAIGDAAEAQIPSINRLINSIRQVPNIPVQTQALGGPISFFDIGGQARGTDTVPAMLSPGEFVVNASSSRRFFSELVAINSGKAPVFRQEGGPVNNTFTGDINVNMPEGQSADGRTIARQLRRELRRKTSKV